MVSDTSARPSGAREEVPAKMTSAIEPPRRDLAPCSPITQDRASTTLDLPEPLGPTTQVMPGSRCRVVAEAKDLNPRSVSVLRCTTAPYPRPGRRMAALAGVTGTREWLLQRGEPERNLAGGGLRRVRAVHEVLDHRGVPGAREVATDGARGRGRRLGAPGQRPEALDHPGALDNGSHERAGAHELHERLEVRPAAVLGVVLTEQLRVGGAQLEGDDAVALGLDAAQDLPDKVALDAVGLDEDEGAFFSHAADPTGTPRPRRTGPRPPPPRARPGRRRSARPPAGSPATAPRTPRRR